MRTAKLSTILFAALCCLLLSSTTQAQTAYGYASISVDPSTNTVTGYSTTELDYETSLYYDAEVQAHIEDENGNVVASGSSSGNPVATSFLDYISAVLCIRFSIVGYIIASPRFLGCNGGGRYDYFGFGDYYWGSYWDYGGFFSNRELRCIFNRLIFIATIISDVIECLPGRFGCEISSDRILPSGLRQGIETNFIPGLNPATNGRHTMTVRCRVEDQYFNGVSGQLVRFNINLDRSRIVFAGGHRNHGGERPLGEFDRTSMRTDNGGYATATYTAPHFGGIVSLAFSAQGSDGVVPLDLFIVVPSLQELPVGINYTLLDVDNFYHHLNHWGTPGTVTGLQQIAEDYKTEYYRDQVEIPADDRLGYNDMSLPYGGKFDLPTDANPVSRWLPSVPHDEHRVGINCDVRSLNVPSARRARLNVFFENRGSTRTLDETNTRAPHWHLRFEFSAPPAQPETSTSHNGAPAAVPGRIEAEQFDSGEYGFAYFVPGQTATERIGVLGPDVAIRDLGGGNQFVGSTVGGQWMNYTVNIASTGRYTFKASVAFPSDGSTFHVEVDGVDKTGSISIPNTGSWYAYQLVTVNDIWLDAGQHVVRLVIEGTGPDKGNFDYFTLNPYMPPDVCSPHWWELRDCSYYNGYWDYELCACQYYGGY